jgi:hypothetical protein
MYNLDIYNKETLPLILLILYTKSEGEVSARKQIFNSI